MGSGQRFVLRPISSDAALKPL